MDGFENHQGHPDFVLSLARGLAVIEAFQGSVDGVTVAEVASRTSLSRASVRRLLLTLEALGYANRTGAVYRLSPRTLRLGFSFLSSHSLVTLATPILEEISAVIHESSSLSVLEGDEIVYLARAATNRVMSVGLSVGSRLPAYFTSMGRVLLAALPDPDLAEYMDRVVLTARTHKTIVDKADFRAEIERVRSQGYALVDEELELGLRALAVPVVNRTGRTLAAMNTGVQASRASCEDMIARLLPTLAAGASSLGTALG